jgi:N6-adenosine-specific RNA methylase IME4
MSENIEYIVDDKGNKIKAIISLDLLSRMTKKKSLKPKELTKDKIKKYAGSIKLNIEPVEHQRGMRNEWE